MSATLSSKSSLKKTNDYRFFKLNYVITLCFIFHLIYFSYMVIISEEDVICRGCATMINSLDRLEKEVGSLRSIVLRYLEKKYDMEDGELVNARSIAAPSTAPAPQPKSSVKGKVEHFVCFLYNLFSFITLFCLINKTSVKKDKF